jgi:hypothetical protein
MASESVLSLILDPRRIETKAIPPSYFLIDGDDWLSHIEKRYQLGLDDAHSRKEKGLAVVDKIVKASYERLNMMGIQPVVFLDSASLRRESLVAQMKKTLDMLQVDIVECPLLELPLRILSYVKSLSGDGDGNDSEQYACYVYGSAVNDVWAVGGVKFILFDSLTVNDRGDTVLAPIWTRTIVASLLYLDDARLTELLLLVGNRYTKGIFLGSFYASCPSMKRREVPAESTWTKTWWT